MYLPRLQIYRIESAVGVEHLQIRISLPCHALWLHRGGWSQVMLWGQVADKMMGNRKSERDFYDIMRQTPPKQINDDGRDLREWIIYKTSWCCCAMITLQLIITKDMLKKKKSSIQWKTSLPCEVSRILLFYCNDDGFSTHNQYNQIRISCRDRSWTERTRCSCVAHKLRWSSSIISNQDEPSNSRDERRPRDFRPMNVCPGIGENR